MKIGAPPIKSQGIKTKLVPWINSLVPHNFNGTWIEPFMGTGAVAFNIAPKHAILCDTNPHLINFYSSIAARKITTEIAKDYLEHEGNLLLTRGEDHYYSIRDRFNKSHSSLDFLFLSRAGFNGMIRFNRKGIFNIPFCRKPQRFAQSYVTKIINQIAWVDRIIKSKNFVFKCQDFSKTITEASSEDIIYCDPPYIDRHADYYNGWNDADERELFRHLSSTSGIFILSTWHHNDYRENDYVKSLWSAHNILTRGHFYHVGGSKKNRNPITEALVTNLTIATAKHDEHAPPLQHTLLETRAGYKAA